MAVQTFIQPNFPVQSAAAYKANIDSAISVLAKVAGQFAPHEVSTPNMTVQIDAGKISRSTGSLVEKSQQTSAVITAPVSNPRIDRININGETGALNITAGSESATPAAPAIPGGFIAVAQILLQTSTTSITNSIITDERPLYTDGL